MQREPRSRVTLKRRDSFILCMDFSVSAPTYRKLAACSTKGAYFLQEKHGQAIGFGNLDANPRYNLRFCPKYCFNQFEFRSLRFLSLCSACRGMTWQSADRCTFMWGCDVQSGYSRQVSAFTRATSGPRLF